MKDEELSFSGKASSSAIVETLLHEHSNAEKGKTSAPFQSVLLADEL